MRSSRQRRCCSTTRRCGCSRGRCLRPCVCDGCVCSTRTPTGSRLCAWRRASLTAARRSFLSGTRQALSSGALRGRRGGARRTTLARPEGFCSLSLRRCASTAPRDATPISSTSIRGLKRSRTASALVAR
eukprot:Amastigsp_a843934_29.p4 type:complete len:130 gc:universal Amastigsp_a843934_29:660-271(-)